MQKLISILFLAILASCNNQGTTAEKKDSVSEQTADREREQTPPFKDNTADAGGCYMQVIGRDTIVASLQQDGAAVSGRLSFDNFEKDGSTGSVTGHRNGDVIKLLYSFASEGMNSVMEVYFKLQADALTRGIGEMDVKGDTAFFVNPGSITYPSSGTIMKKLPCESVLEKYK